MIGAIIGAIGVLGNVGVGGVPAIISIKKDFWLIYGIGTVLAMVVPAILTVIFSKFSKEEAKEIVEE